MADSQPTLRTLPTALVIAAAVAFGFMGLILYLAPSWSAANFPWKITPVVAMTMGGWYLGSAVMAGLVAFHRRWEYVYSCALYVGTFSVSEALVLILHRSKLILQAPLAWPYIGMLMLAVAASLTLLVAWFQQKPSLVDVGGPVRRWMRGVIVAFLVFVFFLAIVAFSGHWIGLNGQIFPVPLSLFTLHSFGAFYLSLAVSVIPLLRAQRAGAITVHVQGGLSLIAFITLAALVYIQIFNFSEHPFQFIYLGVYLGVFFLAVYYLWWQRAYVASG
jgi:hypothetical protein